MLKFDLDDILLTPAVLSMINSRSQVNPYDENGMLPIMTAPMDTVVDENNWIKFVENKITAILPRNNKYEYSYLPYRWYSYGLIEFEELFINKKPHTDAKLYALIDVANGHMIQLFEMAKKAKELYGDKLVLMVGNIANPNTALKFASIGVDYIRVGIGGGAGCLTSVQTGVGYPMGSLIKECSVLIQSSKTKIVADGGFKKFADINKALALGADYVMLGSMLNKCLESCGSNRYKTHSGDSFSNIEDYKLSVEIGVYPPIGSMSDECFMMEGLLYKKYRGMSTKEVQKAWGREKLKTSEGISTYNKVEYTLEGFVENLTDYLKSAMSYTGSRTLEEFKKYNCYELITQASFNRFNK